MSILSDVENLDVSTWSWLSVYNTSSDAAKGTHADNAVAGPSPGVIVGAVASLAALFCILLIVLHVCNRRYHPKHNEDDDSTGKEANSLHEAYSMNDRDELMYGEVLSDTSGTTIAPNALARRGGQRVKRSFTDNGYSPTSPNSFHRFFTTSNVNELPHSKKDSLEGEGYIMPPDSPLEELHEATVEAKVPQILYIGTQPTGLVAATSKIERPYSTFDGEEFIVLGGGDERMMSPVSEKSISLGIETLTDNVGAATESGKETSTLHSPPDGKGKERAATTAVAAATATEQSNQDSILTKAEDKI